MDKNSSVPILFPFDPDEFWERMRALIKEELLIILKQKAITVDYETPGMSYKPLYKMIEVCKMLGLTRPTIYALIKDGKLRPFKIRSRVYFLWGDIEKLLSGT